MAEVAEKASGNFRVWLRMLFPTLAATGQLVFGIYVVHSGLCFSHLHNFVCMEDDHLLRGLSLHCGTLSMPTCHVGILTSI